MREAVSIKPTVWCHFRQFQTKLERRTPATPVVLGSMAVKAIEQRPRTAQPNYIPKMYKCTSMRSTRIPTPSCVTREQPQHHIP